MLVVNEGKKIPIVVLTQSIQIIIQQNIKSMQQVVVHQYRKIHSRWLCNPPPPPVLIVVGLARLEIYYLTISLVVNFFQYCVLMDVVRRFQEEKWIYIRWTVNLAWLNVKYVLQKLDLMIWNLIWNLMLKHMLVSYKRNSGCRWIHKMELSKIIRVLLRF